jgi:hypothetical protein
MNFREICSNTRDSCFSDFQGRFAQLPMGFKGWEKEGFEDILPPFGVHRSHFHRLAPAEDSRSAAAANNNELCHGVASLTIGTRH